MRYGEVILRIRGAFYCPLLSKGGRCREGSVKAKFMKGQLGRKLVAVVERWALSLTQAIQVCAVRCGAVWWVGFLSRFGANLGKDFDHFDLELGMVFRRSSFFIVLRSEA